MPFLEPLWKKIERQAALAQQYPEFDVAQSPDKVLQVDNYRLRNGGPVSEWSQTVMRLARHAAELEQQRQAGAPDLIQGSADWETYNRKRAANGPVPGVPRAVAEIDPEGTAGLRQYGAPGSLDESGQLWSNTAERINRPIAEDLRNHAPGVGAALDAPVLGTVLREATRPTNWMSAAIAPLSFAPKAGMGVRVGAEIASATASSLVGQKVSEVTGNQWAGFGAGLLAGQLTGAGVSRVGGLAGQADNVASSARRTPVRVVGKVSFEDSKALDGSIDVNRFADVSDSVLNSMTRDEEDALLEYVRTKEGVSALRTNRALADRIASKSAPIRDLLRGMSPDGRTIRAYRFESGIDDTAGLESWALSPKAPRAFSNIFSGGRDPITVADIDINSVIAAGATDDLEILVRTDGGLFGQADNATSAFKSLPDPARPEMPAVRVPSGGSALSEVLDSIIPGEDIGTGLLRRYEGRLNTEGLVIKREIDTGNDYLRATGIGKMLPSGRLQVGRTPEMEQLFKALHGEGEPPLALKPIFDDLKAKVADETARSIDFDPKFMPHPDYFPRGWKAPKETRLGQARMGATPGFKKARNDATFSEMLDDGWEPPTWNPYEMLALRRVAGAEFREQTDLVRYLQDSGQAVLANGPLPDGYRVPRVGPAFEGKPRIIPGEEGALPSFAGYTPRWAVPDHVADVVENMYGTRMSLGKVGPVDVLGTIRGAGQLSKRSKLLGSLFQQVDFSTRVGFAQFGGAVDSLTRGHPVEAVQKTFALPAEIGKLAYANVSSGRRAALRDQILSDATIFRDRPGITLKGISNAGWSQTDITILPRDIRSMLDFDTPKNLPAQALSAATGKIRKLDKAMNDGLFDGVYPQAQISALRNFVVPSLARQHPDWTDEQIMGSAAVEVNKMFSTLGNFQTIFANRGMRELTRNLIFSTNEPEALIKGALSTVKGPNKRLWAENYIGGVLFLAGVANAIHLAATGEPLPLDRYSPVTLEKGGNGPGGLNFNPIPFNYNTRFMSPNVPGLEGRNGTQVAIDLMGQMDTIFRVLDPNAFITSRFSAPLRAGVNQMKGEDFFGRPLDTPKERISQAVSDLVAPIGAGNVMGALGIGPDNEGRLGNVGQLIQTTGVNLRAENSQQLRDRVASEYAQQQGFDGVSNVDELAKALNLTYGNALKRLREANPSLDAELTQRREEQAVGDPETQAKIDLDAKRASAKAEQETDDARVQSGEIDWDQWKDNRTRRLSEVRGFSESVYGTDRIEDPKNAYEEWLNVVRDNETPDGINWDAVDAWVSQQDDRRQKFIEDNTGLYGTKLEKERRAVAGKLDDAKYFDIRDRVWQRVASRAGLEGYASVDDFSRAVSGRIKQRLAERGITDEATIEIITNDVMDGIPAIKVWSEISNDVEEAWIQANVDLAKEAVKYGYLKPGSLRTGEKGAIIASGVR